MKDNSGKEIAAVREALRASRSLINKLTNGTSPVLVKVNRAISILSAEPAQVTCKTCRYSHHGVCEVDQGEDCFQHGYKYYEPAQDDGNSEVEEGDIVAYVFDDGEYTVEQDFSDDAIGRWRDRLCRPVIIMRAAEVKRRLEEAKE